MRRQVLDLSQERLADELGITFQQLQKYEKGHNRMSAGRLYRLSHILEVPIEYFFEEATSDGGRREAKQAGLAHDLMWSRETAKLLRAYYSIEQEQVRDCFQAFLRRLSKVLQNAP